MNVESLQRYLLTLPDVVETMQWGANLVFWMGDKAVGGKMFALIDLDEGKLAGGAVISYAAGPERFHELLELDGVRPAPYLARAHWVAIDRWDVFRTSEWEQELAAARGIVAAKMPLKVKAVLALPKGKLKVAVAAGRKAMAAKAEKDAAKKAARTKERSHPPKPSSSRP